jgi:hypothetical protein
VRFQSLIAKESAPVEKGTKHEAGSAGQCVHRVAVKLPEGAGVGYWAIVQECVKILLRLSFEVTVGEAKQREGASSAPSHEPPN